MADVGVVEDPESPEGERDLGALAPARSGPVDRAHDDLPGYISGPPRAPGNALALPDDRVRGLEPVDDAVVGDAADRDRVPEDSDAGIPRLRHAVGELAHDTRRPPSTTGAFR